MKIDPEIQSLLTPLTKEEFDQLERNILQSLHVEPLVLLKINGSTEPVLGDGHNRFNICTKHGIDYEMRVMKFDTRESAIQWVIDNQLGRRNLSSERISYYRGKEYLNTKKPEGQAKKNSATVAEFSGETAKRVADKHGVSPRTVENDAKFAKAVDALPEPAKAAVLSGDSGETKKSITEGAKPILCPRCGRVGAVAGCQECERLRNKPTGKPPKAGKPRFDEKLFDKAYGGLTRMVDQRGNAMGKGPHHKRCQEILGEFLEEYKLWKKETA